MKKLLVVSLILCSMMNVFVSAVEVADSLSLEVRVADAVVCEAALGHVVTAFEESEESRKQCIKSLLSDCQLTNTELQTLKALVRELRELLPVVFLLQSDYNRAHDAALDQALNKEFAPEIGFNIGAVVSGRFITFERSMSEDYYDRNWLVAAAVDDQFAKDSKYSRFMKAKERLEEIGEQAQEFFKVMAKQFTLKMAQKGDSLKGAAALYAGLMFNQLAEAVIEAADELHDTAA